MNQLRLGDSKYEVKRKPMRREPFPAETEQVVPWDKLLAVIEPPHPKAGNLAAMWGFLLPVVPPRAWNRFELRASWRSLRAAKLVGARSRLLFTKSCPAQ